MCQAALHHCDRQSESINLEERFILAQGFSSLLVGSFVLGPGGRTTWWSKAKKEREVGPGVHMLFKDTPKLNFLSLGSNIPFKDTTPMT